MGHRTWIKMYADKWLRGTLRDETAATRGIWADVLMLAADGAYGDKGIVQIAPKLGLSDEQISRLLWLSEPEWCAAKTRLIETNRIMLGDGNTLHIVNWTKYQSEYDRQKPQRQSKSSKGKKKKKRGGAG